MPPKIPGVEILHEVGRGARNLVYRGHCRGRQVAVKVPRQPDSSQGSQEYLREASLQARASGAGLPAIYQVGCQDGLPFLLSEFVEGQTLADRLKQGLLSPDQAQQLLQDLARSLAWIHRRGLIHRDLKPANIMLTPSGQARLIDFGLATRSHLQQAAGLTGTFLYSAPEQLGMLDRPLDGRADLYSLGVVLFEALTGRPPFLAEDPSELLRQHAVTPPPELAELCPQAPPQLVQTIHRLLAKDPDDRFAEAASLLESPPSDPPPPLLDRQEELQRLQQHWQATLEGSGRMVLITAPGGLGKSALARHFARQCRSSSAFILRARCHPTGAPFGLLRELIQTALRFIPHWPQADLERLARAAGSHAPILAEFSPELAPWLGHPPPRKGSTYQALSEFLLNIARAFPILTLVEDLHWIDRSSQQVLERLMDRLGETRCLLLATSREPRPLPPDHILNLQPLSHEALDALMQWQLGGSVEPAMVDQLMLASDGNPLAAQELLEAALDEGLFVPHWGSWRCQGEGLAELQLQGDLLATVVRRLDHLSESQQHILRGAAILGLRFSPEELSALHPGPEVHAVLAEARRLKIIDAHHRFIHERVREALLAGLSPEETCQLHRQAGRCSQQPFARAEHFWSARCQAGPDPELFQASRQAGLLALQGQAPEEAYEYFRRAELAGPTQDLCEAIGDASLATGRFEEAFHHFQAVWQEQLDPLRRAELARKLAQVHLLRLECPSSLSKVEEGLSLLGLRLCPNLPVRLGWLLWNGLRSRRQQLPGPEHQEVAQRLFFQAVQTCTLDAHPTQFLEVTVRGLQVARAMGESPALATFLAVYAVCLTALGLPSLGQRELRQAIAIAERLDDPGARSLTEVYQALATRLSGEEEAASRMSVQVLTHRNCWLATTDYLHCCLDLIHNLHFRGYIAEALHWAEAAIRKIRQERQSPILAITLSPIFAASGRNAEARTYREMARQISAEGVRKAAYLVSSCHSLLEQGELGAELEQLLSEFRAQAFNPRTTPFHLSVFYLIEGHVRYRQNNLSGLRRTLRDLARTHRHPLFRTHTCLLQAAAARMAGQVKNCRKLLAQAEELAHRYNNAWVRLEVARLRALLLRDQGLEQASQMEARVAACLALELGWMAQWQRLQIEFQLKTSTTQASTREGNSQSATMVRLQRTLKTLLQLSLTTTQQLEPARLYPLVLQELVHILGAQRALLFLQQGEELHFETGVDHQGQTMEAQDYAASLLHKAVRTREVVRLRGDEQLSASESVLAHDLRSVLVAPMLLRERLLGVIYLDSRLARGVFSQEDAQVVQALASQVAITLETARAARLEVHVRSEREQRRLAEQLGEMVGALLSHLDRQAILTALMEGLQRTLGYDQGTAFALQEGQFSTSIQHGEALAPPDRLDSHRPQLEQDGHDLWTTLRNHSGLLGAVRLRRSRPFSASEVEILHTFTGYAAMAVENARLFADVERLATTDELTGLLNRRHFFHQAQMEFERARRLGHELTFIMFDVDHFKKFNDTYGHSTGDIVLKTVSARTRGCLRGIDLQGRLGGEEFAVLLVGTGLAPGLSTAERLRLAIADSPFDSQQGPLQVRISLGVAQPSPQETLEQVMERADQALYRAKGGGRNRVEADRLETTTTD